MRVRSRPPGSTPLSGATNAPVTLGLLGLGVLAAVGSVIARRKAKNA